MTDRLLSPHEHETMNGSLLTLAQGRLLILSQGSQCSGTFPFTSFSIRVTLRHQAARGVMMMVANHEDTVLVIVLFTSIKASSAIIYFVTPVQKRAAPFVRCPAPESVGISGAACYAGDTVTTPPSPKPSFQIKARRMRDTRLQRSVWMYFI